MFTPGRNMAMKVPPHQVDDTVRFYRDVLGLADAGVDGDSVGFHFGDKVLWIDAVPTVSQAELWLEIQTDDLDAAAAHFEAHGVTRCDDIEPLGEFPGFWISSPAQMIHLVANDNDADDEE
jgi:catechol 2,3-dioxygenase-like lactoylglutathione lyase family enzyme